MIKTMQEKVTLRNGLKMPGFGLGAYKSAPGAETYTAVRNALEVGYRLIDTATFYENEEDVGRAVKDSGIPREEIFITTKIWPSDFKNTKKTFEQSLSLMNCDYIDLYLLHWPGLDEDLRLKTWDTILEFEQKGLLKGSGVSNFKIHHLENMIEKSGVVPVNNQIELHPWFQRRDICEYCAKNDISVTSWGPIFHGHLSEVPMMDEIGEAYGRTGAQIALRWQVQKGINIIPKSVRKERIIENSNLFDFEITKEDMKKIDDLDRNVFFGKDSDTFPEIV